MSGGSGKALYHQFLIHSHTTTEKEIDVRIFSAFAVFCVLSFVHVLEAPQTIHVPSAIIPVTPLTIAQVAQTVQPTPTPRVVLSTPEPSGEQTMVLPISYIVVPGDTLSIIAERFGVTVDDIVQLNNIQDENTIDIGEHFIIGKWIAPASTPATTGQSSGRYSSVAAVKYVVQPGDTLTSIEATTGMSVDHIAQNNGILVTDMLWSGEVLRVTAWYPSIPSPVAGESRQIIVVRSSQRVYAFENGSLIREFVVSTGVAAFQTVLGDYAIYVKHTAIRMTGPGYDLPDVPYTMYFYKGYGLHGTYWHHSFGTPMSHGCVNMKTKPDAEWLFHWASVGTPVHVIQ